MAKRKRLPALLALAALFLLLLGAGYPEKVEVFTEEPAQPSPYHFLAVSPYTDEVALGFMDGKVLLYDRDGNFRQGFQFPPIDSGLYRLVFNRDGTVGYWYHRNDTIDVYDRAGNFVREDDPPDDSADLMRTLRVDSRLVEYRVKKNEIWKEYPDGRQELFCRVQLDGKGDLAGFFFFFMLPFVLFYDERSRKKLYGIWMKIRRRKDDLVRLAWGAFLVAIWVGLMMAAPRIQEKLKPSPAPAPDPGFTVSLLAGERVDNRISFVSVSETDGTVAVCMQGGKVLLYDREGAYLQGYQLPKCSEYDSLLFRPDGALGYYDRKAGRYCVFDRAGTVLEEIPVEGDRRQSWLMDQMADTDEAGNRYRACTWRVFRIPPSGEEEVFKDFSWARG